MEGVRIRDISGLNSKYVLFDAVPQASLFGAALAPTSNIETVQPNDPMVTASDYFTPYDQAFLRRFWQFKECELFDDFTKFYRVNPFAHFIVEALVTLIGGEGFHLEGDEAAVKQVESFFFDTRFAQKLDIITRHMLIYGNAYLNLEMTPTKKLTGLDYIHGASVRFDQDYKTGKAKIEQYVTGKPAIPLDPSHLLQFKLWDTGDSYYGMSLLRPNYFFLLSLFDMCSDIPMAVKRAAYVPMVVKLDLTGVSDTNRETYVKRFRKMVSSLVSAASNFVVDKRHDIIYPENSGRGLNLPLNDLMKPIFSIVMMNSGLATGLIFPQDVSREAVGLQDQMSVRQIGAIRHQIKLVIDNYILPLVTKGEVKFYFNKTQSELQLEKRLYLDLYTSTAISREYLLDRLDIKDTGKDRLPAPSPTGGGFGPS